MSHWQNLFSDILSTGFQPFPLAKPKCEVLLSAILIMGLQSFTEPYLNIGN